MSKYLVIVESPAKAKTIRKYLGPDYKIAASMGHIRDLPQSHLGVDINKDFNPMYITITGKNELIKSLKEDASSVEKVFLATDPDREGEAISWHLSYLLKIDPQTQCRITFNEITKNAVVTAVQNPRKINLDLVDAQQARRVLDRIVGYEISPILWKKVRKGLSAGRVQSVATRIICDREKEIEEFIPEEYWTIETQFRKEDGLIFSARFHGKNGKKYEIKNKDESDEILTLLSQSDFIVSNVKKSEKKRTPAPPFITSTLQQEASRKLGYSAQKTMMVAQQLYEGVDIGNEGSVGLITYMRTDSVRISEGAIEEARSYIQKHFGNDYLPDKPRQFKTKSAAQDAHEAIRPSYIERDPESLKEMLSGDQYKLYKLIWDRFIACQMEAAVFDTLTVEIEGTPKAAGNKNVLNLRATGSKLVFKGFMALYVEGRDDEEEEANQLLPSILKDERLTLLKTDPGQHFTEPPPRYTEATLVKALEEKGIGRPSTYAPTISTIITRGYVERNKKQLLPTDLGKIVNQLMMANFTDIVNVNFTAEMENKLDKVEEGSIQWKELLREFYTPFKETVKKAEAISKVEIPVEISDVVCDKCGKTMVIKSGRFGKFLACPGFPACKNTKPLVDEAGVKCPKCAGKILFRKTKRGKKYLGCENYPKCDFMTWDMPSDKSCPKCSNFLTQKAKGELVNYKCSNPECDYIEEQQKEESAAKKTKRGARKAPQSEAVVKENTEQLTGENP
ncbi:MAG: type I DNA topoisomerase [Clostridia bacterium]|nr:type I DNA topoisomerase [Clostridia bacterium]